MISTTMGSEMVCESYNASGFVGSRRNASETAGSTVTVGCSDSDLNLFLVCDESSTAGLFLETSSPSNRIIFT